ncbi:MAG: beta-ribofuranosylaminobenzene 5'-phosphate synthase [Burkholderiaceae bacterium]|nr:beta-ribofuranosylaminobenzene 5'-phosphate synthase [Burkholderiaceae bacterium]
MNAPGLATRPERAADRRVVSVRAPGRLHLGFLDPGGSLGRRYGSLGLVVDGFETQVDLSDANAHRVTAATPSAQSEIDRAESHLHALTRQTGLDQPLHLHLEKLLPAHAGFGSGTQLALAIGRAFAIWHGLEVSSATLAHWLGRGLRSGVGIGGFEQGGLLVDGGPGADGQPAPVLSRVALPEDWRVVVVLDSQHHGLSGHEEKRAIAALPQMPQSVAADICHQVLMRVLPGAACAEFAPFAAGITRIQQQLGAHFAPAQGGDPYTSSAVGRLVRWIGEAAGGESGAAIGQSSWGPTGFAILPSQQQAEALVEAARAAQRVASHLTVQIVSGRNHGARLDDRLSATQ